MRALWLLALAAVACARTAPAPSGPAARLPEGTQRLSLASPELRGVSGLTRAADGAYWIVNERTRHAFRIRLEAGEATVEAKHEVRGGPDGADLEAIAALPDGRLAFGTESRDPDRAGDPILFATVADGVVQIADAVLLDYGELAVTPERNRGIEGLCAAPGFVVAGLEIVREVDGRRISPVVVHRLEEGDFVAHQLFLTSDTGKLSGLACHGPRDGALEVHAIERHFEVLRVVRFSLPIGGQGSDVTPTVVHDLAGAFEDTPPNFEGLAYAPGGGLVLVSDNDYGGVSGPTRVLVLPHGGR